MTAIAFCGDEEVVSFFSSEQPIPRIGEQIVVEKDTRRTFRVFDVIHSSRVIPVAENRTPMFDRRIEIHVTEE